MVSCFRVTDCPSVRLSVRPAVGFDLAVARSTDAVLLLLLLDSGGDCRCETGLHGLVNINQNWRSDLQNEAECVATANPDGSHGDRR